MTYTAYWYRLPHGREEEAMHAQWKEFNNVEAAIAFICRKAERTRGIYWAGARVEDESGNDIYTITYMYDHDDRRPVAEAPTPSEPAEETVLSHIERARTGAPTAEEKAHDETAKRHFMAYCDSGQCVRERAGYKRGENWHEGVCLECCYNPYTMTAKADAMAREQARTLGRPFRERKTVGISEVDQRREVCV